MGCCKSCGSLVLYTRKLRCNPCERESVYKVDTLFYSRDGVEEGVKIV